MTSGVRPGRKKKTTLADALTPTLSLLYSIPAAGGYGEHWQLAPHEARTLAENLEACAATLPPGKVTEFQKFLEKIIPWGVLAWTSWILTVPRVQATRQLLAERSSNVIRTHGAGRATPGVEPSAASLDGEPPSVGVEPGPGSGTPHVTELFVERQR